MSPDLEAAWKDLDTAERAYPRCEHITAWEAEVKAARDAYRALLSAADQTAEAPPEPAPVSPSLPDDTSHQEPLPGLGEEAA